MKRIRFSSLLIVAGIFVINVQAQNVGIGTNTPSQHLDVAGAVKFTGALMPGGNAGTSGLALTSQGSGMVPIWASATANQAFTYVYSTKQTKVDYNDSEQILGALTTSITVPSTGTYDVWIYTDGGTAWFGARNKYQDSDRYAMGQISIWIDGVRCRNYVTQNNTSNGSDILGCQGCADGLFPWALCWRQTLSAGTHTIWVKGKVYKMSSYYCNSTNETFSVLSFCQKSPFQNPFAFWFDWAWLIVGLIKT